MTTGTQTTIQIKDAEDDLVHLGAILEPGSFIVPLQAPAGSGGQDFSLNAPIAPMIGVTVFGGSGTYSTWVLAQTIAANNGAHERIVRNLSSQDILLALDDGTAGTGTTPANSHLFLLKAPSSQAPNDNAFRSERFKGRIRIWYAPSTTPWVAAIEI